MEHGTALLFGLAGVALTRVGQAPDAGRLVEVVSTAPAAARCPDRGTLLMSVKANARS